MSKYTKQSKVEDYLGRSLTTGEASMLNDIIEYISEFIKAYTVRDWLDIDITTLPTIASKIFDGNGQKELQLQESFTEFSKVEILDGYGNVINTFTTADGVALYPLNEDYKESILLQYNHFPERNACIKITAQWTDGVVPSDVVNVCSYLVSREILSSSVADGYKKESIEGYSYELLSAVDRDDELRRKVATLDKRKRYML